LHFNIPRIYPLLIIDDFNKMASDDKIGFKSNLSLQPKILIKFKINLNKATMKKIHQYLGLLMLLPFLAWAVTGVFFFIKPGYKAAYESLPIKSYALVAIPEVQVEKNWNEVRWIRSILGNHLLIKNKQGWQQINSQTMQQINAPSEQQIRQLINDAIQLNPKRYGQIQSVDGLKVNMDTGVEINLNWSKMSLYQSGTDTQFINNMYKVHYLQWTGFKSIDKVLGIIGLGLVVILALLGLSMMFRRKQNIQ
jgi:hypothetical protein